MTSSGYRLFDTSIGRCAIVWGTAGIVGVTLPERGDRAMHARIQRRHPAAVEQRAPSDVAAAVDDIRRLLSGEDRDLSWIALDMNNVPEFDRRVYTEARSIRRGETVTYGEIAGRLGGPGLARAVGQALGRNPFAIVVPCHRVLAAGGKPGGFSAPGGLATKQRLLEIEGARRRQGELPLGRSR